MLVDSHCHLNFPDFSEDIKEMMARARRQGVGAFLNICTKLDEMEPIQTFTAGEPDVFCTVGIHPHEATASLGCVDDLKATLEEGLQFSKVVGIGETGLDFFYDNSVRADQEASFRIHCALSESHGLPLIIHTRDGEEDTIRILDDYPKATGVLHCFSGSTWLAREAVARGFYLSCSGIITFKKADALRQTIGEMPLSRLLVETDAPFLAPIPYRGKRNEPAFVVETAKAIAQLKGISFDAVAEATTANFFQLFTKARMPCG